MKHIEILLLFFAFSISSWSQTNCPPDDPNCSSWSSWQTETLTYNLLGFEDAMSISYRTRTCNGKTEVQFDESTLQAFGNFQYMTNKTIIQMMREKLAEKLTAGSVIQCDFEDPAEVVYHTEKVCSIELNCKVQVNPDEMICDTGYEGSPPIDTEQVGGETVYYYYTSHWQVCGTSCCTRTYNVCSYYDSLNNTWTNRVESATNAQHPNSDCSGEGVFYDLDTGDPLDCYSNCD